MEPKEVSDALMAYPAVVVGKYLPMQEDIPKEFWRDNEWTSLAHDWFFGKIKEDSKFYPKEGIDAEKAFRHCNCILRSYQPKHEHKIAGVAYLMSQFFEKVEL